MHLCMEEMVDPGNIKGNWKDVPISRVCWDLIRYISLRKK